MGLEMRQESYNIMGMCKSKRCRGVGTRMRGHWYKTTVMLTMVLMLAGCGGDGAEAEQTAQTEQVEQTEQTLEQVLEEHFLAAEDAEDVATVVSQYAEETPDPVLAEFLISYYQDRKSVV